MKILSYASLLTFASIGLATAADLPSKKTTPKAPASSAYSWAGSYVGLTGGYNLSGRLTGSDADAARAYIPEAKGALVGVVAGYNFQSGSWVYGPEFDLGYSLSEGKKSATYGQYSEQNKNSQGVLGSARMRLGYAFDNVLVFATAGAAGSSVKLTYKETGTNYAYSEAHTQTLSGYTLGAGLEYGVTKEITTRLEYRYASYQDKKFGDGKFGLDTHDIRAGLAYKF